MIAVVGPRPRVINFDAQRRTLVVANLKFQVRQAHAVATTGKTAKTPFPDVDLFHTQNLTAVAASGKEYLHQAKRNPAAGEGPGLGGGWEGSGMLEGGSRAIQEGSTHGQLPILDPRCLTPLPQ